MDVCEGMFKSLQALHNREISGLFAKLFPKNQMENAKKDAERNQQQQMSNDTMPDCVVVDMPESQQGTSNVQHRIVENGISALIPPPPIAPNLQVPCHSAVGTRKEEFSKTCSNTQTPNWHFPWHCVLGRLIRFFSQIYRLPYII
jgi:hypothetical protein